MDLRSIINNEAPEGSGHSGSTPITPVQSIPPQLFREYSQTPQGSQSKHSSQDHGQQGPYASPSTYPGSYQSRPPAPPPLQPPSQPDIRSPSGSIHYSAQSPYRNTPSSSISGGQYPFPANQSPMPQSPAQHHPYPIAPQQRDSYPYQNQATSHIQHQASQGQQSPVPQTPPVITPSNAHPYFQQQRPQSSQSNSTPTSANSQQPYYNQYTQDSPLAASPFPPTQLAQHQRQQSQPGTPLGPPISTQRQPSGAYPQPQSPYQQRSVSSGPIQNQNAISRVSPAPSLPVSNPGTGTPYGSHRSSIEEARRRSQSVRERSLSVSPKTQLPTLPREENTMLQPQAFHNGNTPTPKRKMDDRDSSEPAPATRVRDESHGSSSRVSTLSPQQPAKKRTRYEETPVWARSFIGRVKNVNPLATLKRQVNGKQKAAQPVSTATMPKYNGDHQKPTVVKTPASAPALPATAQVAQKDFKGDGPLGPWEPSITGIQPYEEASKFVADWLFMMVVSRPDAGELASRGVEVEIEAKLGQLINKETNERYWLPVQTECILVDNGKVGFKSSMTEAQHKALNEYLNNKVQETHPDNPLNRSKPRVPVIYAHKHERDRFYELPSHAQASLPASIRAELNPRHTVKVRVTHDQKTGKMLAKIIKTRVANLDLYNPRFPLDCRISINLEMQYDGEVDDLISGAESSRMPDRNKDRLSYTQSHYQIDLTQVTVSDPASRFDKEHELEIEISAAAVREQGRRAMEGQPHQYAELVQGLMDNVRVLSRSVPEASAKLG